MDFCDEDSGGDAVEKAVRDASLARSAKKKADEVVAEALTLARKELKRKGKLLELRKVEAAKKTMRSYFESSRGTCGGQSLHLVYDGSLPNVPGAEPNSEEDYPSPDSGGRGRSKAMKKSVSDGADVFIGSCSGSSDTRILSSKSPLINLSSESENADNGGLREVLDDFEGSESDSDFESLPKKQGASTRSKSKNSRSTAQKRYDRHQKFQTVWAAKLPWAEGIMASDGILQMVKCKVCSAFERKPCIMAAKSDTLFKHDGKRIARKDMLQFCVKKGESYIATQCRHHKNLRLYAAKPLPIVLQQVNQCTSLEARKKRVQFATLFEVLAHGRPMLEYESRVCLYKFLNVPDLPVAHWCDNSGWLMAGYMYQQVLAEIQRLIKSTHYIVATVDEVTDVDNTSWLLVHVYIVKEWVRVLLLVSLQRVECSPNAQNLTKLIMESIAGGGGLDSEGIASKLLSFGGDGASTLQGCRSRVTLQIKEKYALFLIGIHCIAHRCNLAFKALSELSIFGAIEKLLKVTYAYFCKSPKRLEEFRQLVDLTKTKGFKLLKNMQTRWVLLIEPLRRLLSEYRTLLYKMTVDLNDNNVAKVCQASLYRMYENKATSFACDEFWSFNNLLDCSHEQIHIKWLTDLNDSSAVLCFVYHDEQIHAKHNGKPVDKEVWAALLDKVKQECTEASKTLVQELDDRFLAQHVMNAFGILYPQYWCHVAAEENFDKHLRILMDAYGHRKILGAGESKLMLKPLINRDALISQRALFKTYMKSNSRTAMLPPFDINPLTKIWRVLDSNNNLTQNFGEFLKLAEMALVHVIGFVEDERLFSSVGFLKSKLRSKLNENIEVVVGMYSQRVFDLETFPYHRVFDEWFVSGGRGRYLAGT